MNPTPNVEKSTSFKKYYRCDASTVNKLCQTNNLWGVGKNELGSSGMVVHRQASYQYRKRAGGEI